MADGIYEVSGTNYCIKHREILRSLSTDLRSTLSIKVLILKDWIGEFQWCC